MTTKTAKRREQRKRKKDSALTSVRTIGTHIKNTPFNSEEWKELAEGPMGQAYVKARGIVMGLVPAAKDAIRTNAFVDMNPEDIRDAMFEIAKSQEEMADIEAKFYDKFGSYQALGYEDWKENVYKLWMTPNWSPDRETLDVAKNEVLKELMVAFIKLTGSPYISPLSVDDAFEKVTKGRNSGFPYLTSKWASKPEIAEFYRSNAQKLIEGEDTLSMYPHVLFKRVQPNGLTPKMRPVECPPKHEAIAAKCMTDRFIDVFKTMEPYYGFNGGENVHKALAPFMEKEYLVEADFSKFDQTCQRMMVEVFDVIKALTPCEYHAYLDIVLHYYQNAKLITPEGILEGKDGKINGLCSGEGWTSVIGTLANAIAVKYTMSKLGDTDYLRLSFGDDIALATNVKFNAHKFESYMNELGMECNKSKQSVTKGKGAHFSFLGYYHFRELWKDGNEGIFPIMRLAPGLVYAERLNKLTDLCNETGQSEESFKEANKRGIDLLGYAMKLNVARNHKGFEKLVTYFREHEPNKMSTELIAPFSSFENALRNARTSRNMGIMNSPVMHVLYKLEGKDVENPNLEPIEPEIKPNTTFVGWFSPSLDKGFAPVKEKVVHKSETKEVQTWTVISEFADAPVVYTIEEPTPEPIVRTKAEEEIPSWVVIDKYEEPLANVQVWGIVDEPLNHQVSPDANVKDEPIQVEEVHQDHRHDDEVIEDEPATAELDAPHIESNSPQDDPWDLYNSAIVQVPWS